MYKESRNQGTLLCYHKHRVHDAFYENIGMQDLTAHVNFSALIHWGMKFGLAECGLVDQFQFLLSLGFRQALISMLSNEKDIVQATRKFADISQTLLIDMGRKYKVLAQNKGMGNAKLSGFSLV
jgi:SAM-dependent MidA family methyltransferase